MNPILTPFVPVVAAAIGAILAFAFARKGANVQHRRDLASKAYVDLVKGIAEISVAQRGADISEERKATAAIMDAKARICMYGSPKVVHMLAEFWRKGAILDTPERMTNLAKILMQIRDESNADSSELSDVYELLFGHREGPDKIAASKDAPSDGTQQSRITDEHPEPDQAEIEMTSNPEIESSLDALTAQLRESLLHNYQELVRLGNPPGAKSLQLAFITYMAQSLSTLPKVSIEKLRSEGILSF